MRANKINLHAEGMPATVLACVCGEKIYKKLADGIGGMHGQRIWKNKSIDVELEIKLFIYNGPL